MSEKVKEPSLIELVVAPMFEHLTDFGMFDPEQNEKACYSCRVLKGTFYAVIQRDTQEVMFYKDQIFSIHTVIARVTPTGMWIVGSAVIDPDQLTKACIELSLIDFRKIRMLTLMVENLKTKLPHLVGEKEPPMTGQLIEQKHLAALDSLGAEYCKLLNTAQLPRDLGNVDGFVVTAYKHFKNKEECLGVSVYHVDKGADSVQNAFSVQRGLFQISYEKSVTFDTLVEVLTTIIRRHDGTPAKGPAGETGVGDPLTGLLDYITDPANVWNREKFLKSRKVSGKMPLNTSQGVEVDFDCQYLMGTAYIAGLVHVHNFELFYSHLQGFQVKLNLDGNVLSFSAPPFGKGAVWKWVAETVWRHV